MELDLGIHQDTLGTQKCLIKMVITIHGFKSGVRREEQPLRDPGGAQGEQQA
jgi:hypothetical protein